MLRVAAIEAEASDFLLRAVCEIAAAAIEASVVLSAMPADADALALLPGRDAGAELGDDARDFVAGGTGIDHAGPQSVLDEVVAEADTAGLHADADLAGAGLGDFALLEFEVRAGFRDDGDFHFWHLVIFLF